MKEEVIYFRNVINDLLDNWKPETEQETAVYDRLAILTQEMQYEIEVADHAQ